MLFFFFVIPIRKAIVCFPLLIICILSGCSPQSSALLTTAKSTLRGSRASQAVALNPAYHYLRTTVARQTLYLALGSTETTPGGVIETWYSATGEIVRMGRGRIISTSGLPVDWREVREVDVPTWKSALIRTMYYKRERDIMPGYRLSIHDSVTLKAILPPKHSSLVGRDANSLYWFEESTHTLDIGMPIPAARYAVDFSNAGERVIYSEQCLSARLCLTFQVWDAQDNSAEVKHLI